MDQILQALPRNVLTFLSPPPQLFLTDEYDGLEFRWKSLVFRPAMFKTEAIMFGFLFLYFVLAWVGSTLNSRKVTAW